MIFKCKMCGGDLTIQEGLSIATCIHCGSTMTLPKFDDEKRINLFDRANHYRRNNEFDKAMAVYETILNEDKTDAEAYWSLILCKFGIEYVEDPKTHKRIITCNRTQFTSIFADEDYKKALQYADTNARALYEDEAATIDSIQKGILEISSKEEPYDIFISYKDTDSNGRRTPDSVLAQDIYYHLSQEGYKVFFSRITLENILGTAYEPYIFAALNSSKIMVVVGTKPEYMKSIWVKNEWSRFLSLIKQGQKKVLIPSYKDMDPYDLPEEFSHLQSQDMSKLGFMQDLIRGIKKIVSSDLEIIQPNKEISNTKTINGNSTSLLKRGYILLEDHDWENANNTFEQVLNMDPENGEAYLGKLLIDLRLSDISQLKQVRNLFSNNNNYQRAVKYCQKNKVDILIDSLNFVSSKISALEKIKFINNIIDKIRGLSSKKDCDDLLVILSQSKYPDINFISDKIQEIIDLFEFKKAEDVVSWNKIRFNTKQSFQENISKYIDELNSKNKSIAFNEDLIFRILDRKTLEFNFNNSDKIKFDFFKKTIRNLIILVILSVIATIGIIFLNNLSKENQARKLVLQQEETVEFWNGKFSDYSSSIDYIEISISNSTAYLTRVYSDGTTYTDKCTFAIKTEALNCPMDSDTTWRFTRESDNYIQLQILGGINDKLYSFRKEY